jgi:hypothetical protein
VAVRSIREALTSLPRPSLAVAVGLVGAALMVVSAVSVWFEVPVAVGMVIGGREPRAVLLFKVVCLTAGLLAAVLWVRRWRAGRDDHGLLARGAGALIGALLFFPHAIMIWCPTTAGRAAWLHTLHESMTWFGGDVFGLQETKELAWKGHVVVADVLDQATAMNMPTWSPSAWPFGSLRGMAEWFGYSNSFCQFARSGWGTALLGAVLVLFAACRRGRAADPDAMRKGAGAAAAVIGAGMVLGLVPAVIGALELDGARIAAERGEYAAALDRIDLAVRVLPVLGQSSDLALQRGLLEVRLGRSTPRADLYRARLLQGVGRLEQAEAFYGVLVGAGPSDPVAREALRGLLRRGLRELNAGEATRAIETLQGVMQVDRCNIKANYVLQLAYLRAARYSEVRPLADRMGATYRFFRDDTKFPVLAAARENVAYAEYLDGEPLAAGAAWQSIGDRKQLEP